MTNIPTIRNELPTDVAAIEALTIAAFLDAPHRDGHEQTIINALRTDGELSLSLVAVDENRIVGHVAVSPISITDGALDWFGLGPISVAPDRQRQGIGTRLMKSALQELRQLGAAGCVVLGEPAFYSRFGFQPVPAIVLPDVPPEYFLAVVFHGDCPTGNVAYHPAFHA